MSYTQTHSRLWLASLNQESHARTCGYWWIVRDAQLPHTAFRTEYALREWARLCGLTLPELCPMGTHGYWDMTGQAYRHAMHMELSREEFECIPGEQFRALSNGQYTMGIAERCPDGIVTIHTMNPNCRDRRVYDFWESDAITDTGQPKYCGNCGVFLSPRHVHCPACGVPAKGE